jgi:hypothetical protein
MPAHRKWRRDNARHSQYTDQAGDHEYRGGVAGRDRPQRPHQRGAAALLQADRDREQPAHARVQSVEGAECGERRELDPGHG